MARWMTDRISEAFARVVSGLDDLMIAVAEERRVAPLQMDTLSSSLADPRSSQIEMALSNAQVVIQCEADKTSLIAVARACCTQGLVDAAARDRLIAEYER